MAHRLSWEMHHQQELPPFDYDHVLMHLCHNSRCVNPAHLAIGTQQQNIAASVSAGRWHQAGDNNPAAILSTEEVLLIRQLYAAKHTITAIAKQLDRHPITIGDVCRRKSWNHLP
jgi:hypothetical protein